MDEIRVGVFVAMIRTGHQILLVHRRDMDRWCLPGGFLELGESVAECAVREAKEEVGVSIEPEELSLVGVYSEPGRHLFDLEDGSRRQYVTVVLSTASVEEPGALQQSEVRDARFVADLDDYPLVPSHSPWIRDALDQARGVIA